MSQQASIPLGTLFHGRYQVESILGTGGFGTTYLVRDHDAFKRKCVLKELLPKHEGEPKVQELFEREARILGRLNHQGVPRLEAFFADAGHYYLVEEFVDGQNCVEALTARGPFSEAEVCRTAAEILQILKYLHSLNPPVIHRDIKPSNLMLTQDGRCKLIDFGAVREALSATSAAPGDTTIGTPGYMPPEQHHGRAFPCSDLYSLGATLLHLLTGRPPTHWYDAHEGRWTYEGKIDVSVKCVQVLRKLLADLPSNRYASAQDVLNDLPRGDDPGNVLPRQKLIDLIRREGVKLVNDPVRCEGLLRENIAGHDREISALVEALKERVPDTLLHPPSGLNAEVVANGAIERLRNNGMAADLAAWAVNSWKAALEIKSDATVFEDKSDDRNKPKPSSLSWQTLAGIGVAIVAALWFYGSMGSLEVKSVDFFECNNNDAKQLSDGTPRRQDYRTAFDLADAPGALCYELRLTKAASQDYMLDVLFRLPDGSTKTSHAGISNGATGVIDGIQAPKWATGRYAVEFSHHGQELDQRSFEISPAQYDIPSIQANVRGPIKFFEGPSEIPPLDSRDYRSSFAEGSARFVFAEITIANAGQLPRQTFTIKNVWFRNGAEWSQWNDDFKTPDPGKSVTYSITGTNKAGWPSGNFEVRLFVEDKLIASGTFAVN